jgi:Zn-dependent protease with chaperone function
LRYIDFIQYFSLRNQLPQLLDKRFRLMRCNLTPLSKTILLLLCSFAYRQAFSQTSFAFTPLPDDSLKIESIKLAMKQRYLSDSASITGENRKYVIKEYRDRYNGLVQMMKNKELITSPEVNDYLSSLANEIIKNNSQLQQLGARFLFSKVYWPNATSYGEGTIVFNIGLFTKLDNESEVIFVLCHELSHLYLNHNNNSINQYVNTLYSDDFQKKLKDIKKSEYGQTSQVEELAKGIAFNSRRHSRDHESEADSLGLVFMKNTLFDTRESLKCLSLLDSIDNDKYDYAPRINYYFNSTSYPFQKRWLREEENIFGNDTAQDKDEKEIADSLKTHPDCKIRVAKLTDAVAHISIANRTLNRVDEKKFKLYRQLFDFEIIEYCYNANYISKCLYYSLQLLDQYPDNVYLITTIGKCLNTIYKAQKEHTLGFIMDLPSAESENKYKHFLYFMENMHLKDWASVSYYFLQQYDGKITSTKEFIAAVEESKNNYSIYKQ